MEPDDRAAAQKIVRAALREDLGAGDATTDAFVPPEARAKAALVFRRPAVVCGVVVAHLVFDTADKRLVFRYDQNDGDVIDVGRPAATVMGKTRSLLKAERTVLNFVQRLSGIATLTRAFVEALPGIDVYDTRKTTPGLRALEKYAVRVGGGRNHRADLSEIMIKDNHVAAVGEEAIAARLRDETRPVIAEATSAVMAARWAAFPCVRRILLDNLAPERLREAVAAVRAVNPTVLLEVSGGVTLETAPALRGTGINAVSVGVLTHSAPAIDVALELTGI
jgi:nicotinate-nucleotide pyrophosphorylase (carboxylating)